MSRQMQHVDAHELVRTDRGVPVVATTLAITYIGWLRDANEIPGGWVGISLEDFAGISVTLVLPSRAHVHIEPFPTLHVGDLVVRKGFHDPDHANYRRTDLGQVQRIARNTRVNAITYLVLWEGEREARWHTRRMLEPATSFDVEQIREMVDQL